MDQQLSLPQSHTYTVRRLASMTDECYYGVCECGWQTKAHWVGTVRKRYNAKGDELKGNSWRWGQRKAERMAAEEVLEHVREMKGVSDD